MKPAKHFNAVEAREIGEALSIDWGKVDFDQFTMGLEVELEHGKRDPATNVTNDDPLLTGKVALAHLREFPDYYSRLAKLEKEAEQAKKAKHYAAIIGAIAALVFSQEKQTHCETRIL